MKAIIKLIIFIFSFNNICAQTPVKSLADDDIEIPNAYYKDLNNELDAYVGTWKYVNGTTSLTVVIQKKVMQFINRSSIGGINTYEDILIGEYKYVENGVEKVNTLSRLLVQHNANEYNISGNALIYPGSQLCRTCGPNDKRIMLGFLDPDHSNIGYWAYLLIERADNGSIKKIKMRLVGQGMIITNEGEAPFTGYSVKEGEYILEKQP